MLCVSFINPSLNFSCRSKLVLFIIKREGFFKSNNMGRMKEVFERDRQLTKYLKVDMFSYEEMKHYFKSISDIYSGKLKTEDEAK